ncbi:hypothetical protein Sjap_026448 [Stephania japonica]|uniref:Uncharacterized protein n=1 Tax=Stephania japonica TaxID=461633 RepID=A0AAP0HIH8_9MAGN
MAIMRVLLKVWVGDDPTRNCRREPTIFYETEKDSSSDREDEYGDKDYRLVKCIDLIEYRDDHIFDINKPPILDDNDDANFEENVVFGDDGCVFEVTQLMSIPQVSVVALCDVALSTKIRGFRDEAEEIPPHIYVPPIVDDFIEVEFDSALFVFEHFIKVSHS